MLGQNAMLFGGGDSGPVGQIYFESDTSSGATSQTFDFTVPIGVMRICAVIVGKGSYRNGGGLTWANDIPVTPGETLYVVLANAQTATYCTLRRGSGEGAVLLRAGSGGNNSTRSPGGTSADAPGLASYGGGSGGLRSSAGGGAAGYSGNGGDSGTSTTSNGTSGAGGGGGGGAAAAGLQGSGGGGVGLLGQGDNGSGDAYTSLAGGGGGSGGAPGGAGGAAAGAGGKFGGASAAFAGLPGAGGFRAMWGGGRSYPFNAADMER